MLDPMLPLCYINHIFHTHPASFNNFIHIRLPSTIIPHRAHQCNSFQIFTEAIKTPFVYSGCCYFPATQQTYVVLVPKTTLKVKIESFDKEKVRRQDLLIYFFFLQAQSKRGLPVMESVTLWFFSHLGKETIIDYFFKYEAV